MESLNTGADAQPVLAPEGHDAAMIAKVDAKAAEIVNPIAGEDKPKEKILGKFDSAEDLAKAYTELEKKLGQPKAEDPPKEIEKVTEDDANKLVTDAGLKMEDLSTEYETSGSLSDASYEALEKAGVPKAYVDQYIAGLEASAGQLQAEIFQEVGGEEKFGEMTTWAKANMTPEAIGEFNTACATGDVPTVKAAVMSLAYRYQQANGSEPNLVGGAQNGSDQAGFGSLAQLTAAMKDPRYSADSAYRAEVEQKLGRSNIM